MILDVIETKLYKITLDKGTKYFTLVWNSYSHYDDIIYDVFATSFHISKQEYLKMLKDENECINFFIGV